MIRDKRGIKTFIMLFVILVVGSAQAQTPSARVETIIRLKRIVAEHPGDAEARVELGNALDDNGDSAGAVAQYREAIRVNPKFAPAYRNLALAYLRQGQWAAAESAAREAVRIEPSNVPARCDLAVALGGQRKTSEAAREWRQAMEMKRAEVVNYWGGEITGGKEHAFGAAPVEVAAQWLVALTLRNSGDRGAAVREAQRAVETDKNFALGYLTLAQLYTESGKSKEASAAQQRAAELDPALASEAADAGRAEQKKIAEEQRRELSTYREMIPNLIAALHLTGLREEQRVKSRGLLQETAVRMKKLLDTGLDDAEGYVLLGDALRELQEPRATWAYESAIRAARGKEANHAGRAWMGLALLQLKAGRDAAAMEMFSQGLLITPEDAELLNAAAWLAVTSEDATVRNLQKAVEWAKKAADSAKGKNAVYLSTLAEAYFANGQLTDAMRSINAAIALEPNEPRYRAQFEKIQAAAK